MSERTQTPTVLSNRPSPSPKGLGYGSREPGSSSGVLVAWAVWQMGRQSSCSCVLCRSPANPGARLVSNPAAMVGILLCDEEGVTRMPSGWGESIQLTERNLGGLVSCRAESLYDVR